MGPDVTTISHSIVGARLPRAPKAVVFDLDGTLIDSEALVLDAYTSAANRFSLPFTHAQFLTLVGQHREATNARLREYFGDFPLETFHAAVSGYIGDGVAPLRPGVLELLEVLDALPVRYALATSSGPQWVDKHLAAHGLAPRFHAVVTREDVINGKPHPEPYLKAAKALGYDPADILAIEDSPIGLRSAHDAGMMTVLAPDLIQPDDATRALAHLVVSSLHDVAPLVRR